MNEEDAFQAALDANPDDHTTRMVFADWLEERDDKRAEGYRALGRNKLLPLDYRDEPGWNCWTWWEYTSHLGPKWWGLIDLPVRGNGMAKFAVTRREIEDATALAFAKLPAARRAELLNPKVIA